MYYFFRLPFSLPIKKKKPIQNVNMGARHCLLFRFFCRCINLCVGVVDHMVSKSILPQYRVRTPWSGCTSTFQNDARISSTLLCSINNKYWVSYFNTGNSLKPDTQSSIKHKTLCTKHYVCEWGHKRFNFVLEFMPFMKWWWSAQ